MKFVFFQENQRKNLAVHKKKLQQRRDHLRETGVVVVVDCCCCCNYRVVKCTMLEQDSTSFIDWRLLKAKCQQNPKVPILFPLCQSIYVSLLGQHEPVIALSELTWISFELTLVSFDHVYDRWNYLIQTLPSREDCRLPGSNAPTEQKRKHKAARKHLDETMQHMLVSLMLYSILYSHPIVFFRVYSCSTPRQIVLVSFLAYLRH